MKISLVITLLEIDIIDDLDEINRNNNFGDYRGTLHWLSIDKINHNNSTLTSILIII